MKIVCLVINDLSHDQRMIRCCSTLAAAGHDVVLVGRELPTSPQLTARPFRQHRIRCRYHVGKRFYAEFNWRLYRTIHQWEYEVICAVDLDTLLAATLLRRRGVALVYDAHEWFSETPEVASRPIVRAAWRSLGRMLVPRTDARYTVGPMLAQRLAQDYGAGFETVRNVPHRLVSSFSENVRGVILYQGMLNPGRGLKTAIQAMASLPDCRLWVVGDGPEKSRLADFARELGVGDRVVFHGFIAPESLPAITRRAWLGINLLEASSASYYYSLANKSLDYVQAGLPSVQMDFPEYRAVNEAYDTFLLLPRLHPPALVAMIRDLLDEPERYERLRRNCRRAAEDLCWEREAPKLLAIYAGLAVGDR